jgi:uncharacterized membrane protein YfcA
VIAGAVAIGFAAGVVAGMLGIGGGALFVPALVLLLGLSHVDAEATSLLAIVPVSVAGAWRQARYGNLRLRDGVLMGSLALGGAAVGVALANVLAERPLRILFAGFILVVAFQLVRRELRPAPERGGELT